MNADVPVELMSTSAFMRPGCKSQPNRSRIYPYWRSLRRSDRYPNDSRSAGKSQKAYVALFIYLMIKALHLELISNYTSPTFVVAY